jgi:hypothetical protein
VTSDRICELPIPVLKMETMDEDLLEALLAEMPEYSWEELENAPLPRIAPPDIFALQSYNSKVDEGAASAASQATGTTLPSRAVRKAALRAPQHEQRWDGQVFPFGYKLSLPPPPLVTLQTLRAEDPTPRSNVIASPYVRIPPYTFCARTSINWRRPHRSLHKSCYMSFLPFFGEDGYDDESSFRDRLAQDARQGLTRVSFLVPSELEAPSRSDEMDPLEKMPNDEVCGICLSVGCIAHRKSHSSTTNDH